ncbi:MULTISPECIES: hypothetical protein [Methylobacterium]|uniref:Porin n=1 Tax=Methylobacterium thuringiense TaxID=1003091 RepID=A0ABQ4TJ15_9HYPH|nr:MULTISPECIES: hypothetical protein [Methylobacterium]TXN21094.1 hypothetical protein FV217_15545 [Methylobacterium sp. WL9]GJE54015.1 hypothetical protein EKPJFOCH_0487 [Methylobacterium thuringiense]
MRKGFTVFAALVATSLVATPMVIGATQAFATADPADIVTQAVAVAPVEVAPVATAAGPETCAKKVRVVYSGYAPTAAGCLTAAR